ncbi:hypothetical protein HIM_09892 [Hirsutella minnesotensis 3608]|uniref:SMP domain-containing protein n=1 Tax=Hirsutella minnesotensis 3608 TaxID=1043627 RepID=A0A0F7ZS42_9HYPO|nr:hypothetical protein HIM_09892 [Hirsutella minnesotensis 3608]
MASASGSHAGSDALRTGIQLPPNLATGTSHLRPSYQTDARQNGFVPAGQQLAQSKSPTETLEAAITEGALVEDASNLLDSTKTDESAPFSIAEAATKIARNQRAARTPIWQSFGSLANHSNKQRDSLRPTPKTASQSKLPPNF